MTHLLTKSVQSDSKERECQFVYRVLFTALIVDVPKLIIGIPFISD